MAPVKMIEDQENVQRGRAMLYRMLRLSPRRYQIIRAQDVRDAGGVINADAYSGYHAGDWMIPSPLGADPITKPINYLQSRNVWCSLIIDGEPVARERFPDFFLKVAE